MSALKRLAKLAWRNEPVLIGFATSILVTTGLITGPQSGSVSSAIEAAIAAAGQLVAAFTVRSRVVP